MKATTKSRTRRRLAIAGGALLLLLGALIWWQFRPDEGAGAGLPSRTVQAGAVEVSITPMTMDANGAVFRVVLDTHSVELDLDLASAARLRVNGTASDEANWDGSGPGGHHREGTLTFDTPVPAEATVELRITGLSADAVVSWDLP